MTPSEIRDDRQAAVKRRATKVLTQLADLRETVDYQIRAVEAGAACDVSSLLRGVAALAEQAERLTAALAAAECS